MWKLYFPGVILFLISIEQQKYLALSQEVMFRQLMNTRPVYFDQLPPQSSPQFQYTSANTTNNNNGGNSYNGQGRELIKLVRRQKQQFEFPPNFQFPSNSFTGRSAAGSPILSSPSASSSPWSAVAKRAVGLLHHFPRTTTVTNSVSTATTTASPGAIFRITKSISSTFEPKPTLFSYNYQRYSNQSQSQAVVSPNQKPFRPSKHLSFPKRNLLPKLPNHVRLSLSTSSTTTEEPTSATTEEPAVLESGEESGLASSSIEVSDSQSASAFPFQLFNRTRIIRKKRPRPVYRRKLSSESKSIEAIEALSTETESGSINSSSLSPVSETTTESPLSTSKSTTTAIITSTELPRMPLVSSEEVTEVHISPGSATGDNIVGNTEYIVITNAGGGAEVVDRFNPIISSQGQPNNGHDSISVRSRHYHDYHQFPPMPMHAQHQHHHQQQEHQQVHYHHPPHKKVQPSENSLMPLDKTLVYVGMITSWMFWIVVFTWYYFWNNKSLLDSNYNMKQQLQQQNQFLDPSHGKTDSQASNNEMLARRVILNINDFGTQHQQQPGLAAATVQIQAQGQQQQQILTAPVLIPQIFEPPPQQQQFYQQQQAQFRHIIQKRSLDVSRPQWNFSWGQVMYMLSLAQESYDKFDFQSLDCQKKTLCELVQKQTDFGETGRKISNTFSILDVVEGLPMPSLIQSYMKEYKEALEQGKNSSKECGTIYPECRFSLKEVLTKYRKRAASGKF